MLGILPYLYRLVPGNPILQRVIAIASKRKRDLLTRCLYLGLLIGFVLWSLVQSTGDTSGGSLTALSKVSVQIFQRLSIIQLALVALLAPVFTAGAITQERDSQTYDVLLTTPLTNGQIVLGTLLSRVFFVVALLVSGIPVFSITQIFGGVAIGQIVMSFLIAASTALVTGALAIAIATLKVGTRRTIFSFYLFIAVYLVGGYLLDGVSFVHPPLSDGSLARTSWLTGINPFLALQVTFNHPDYLPPDSTQLAEHLRWWPLNWYFSSPAGFYITFMLAFSTALVLPSILLLRLIAQTTLSPRVWLLTKLKLARGDRTRPPRSVWANPIAWREAKTKGSATRATVLRWGFTILGIGAAVAVLVGYMQEQPVAQYVTARSFDALAFPQTLTLYTAEKAAEYEVAPSTLVNINGAAGTLEKVRTKMAVSGDINVSGKTLTKIDLKDVPRRVSAATARQLMMGIVLVAAATILLIVTNAAASTVTREKEDGTLDLLLTTPITSRYYIWGKLRGLVIFVLPLVAVPVLAVSMFVLYDLTRLLTSSLTEWVIFPEAVVVMPVTLVTLAAFAAITGMNMSLRCRTTVRAVMFSVAAVAGFCGLLGFCGKSLLTGFNASSPVSLAFASFSPFTVLTVITNPFVSGGQVYRGEDIASARVILAIFSLAATAGYAGIVWQMYKAMVKNFDMTIRRQSR